MRRSGHSAKNLSLDDPTELNFAGPCGCEVCVFGRGAVVVVAFTVVDEVDVGSDDEECGSSPKQPVMVMAVTATSAAVESARVMPIRRCVALADWFPESLGDVGDHPAVAELDGTGAADVLQQDAVVADQ